MIVIKIIMYLDITSNESKIKSLNIFLNLQAIFTRMCILPLHRTVRSMCSYSWSAHHLICIISWNSDTSKWSSVSYIVNRQYEGVNVVIMLKHLIAISLLVIVYVWNKALLWIKILFFITCFRKISRNFCTN